MKTENQAWTQLQRHASRQLSPGFADRVLRAARVGVEAVPSLFSIFALSAATAVLCFATVTFYSTTSHNSVERDNIEGWQRIAAASEEFAAN